MRTALHKIIWQNVQKMGIRRYMGMCKAHCVSTSTCTYVFDAFREKHLTDVRGKVENLNGSPATACFVGSQFTARLTRRGTVLVALALLKEVRVVLAAFCGTTVVKTLLNP